MRLVLSVIYPVDLYLLPIFPKIVEVKMKKVESKDGAMVFDASNQRVFKFVISAIQVHSMELQLLELLSFPY